MRQFLDAWRNLWRSFALFYDEFMLAVGLSVLQSLALLTVVLAPPVAAGLNNVANRMAHEKRVNFSDFWEGMRQYFWRSYLILGGWAVIMMLLLFNVYFYFQNTAGFIRYLSFLWVSLALIWLSILPYLLPLMLETEPPALLAVYRNAYILAFSRPLYTFILLIQLLLLALLARYLPFLLFLALPTEVALLGNLGVRYLIESTIYGGGSSG
jgi:uncharacterized membrane protein YesL